VNHWELVLLDIWWVVRWALPAVVSVTLWEFLKWEFREDGMEKTGSNVSLFMVVTHLAIYYFSIVGIRS